MEDTRQEKCELEPQKYLEDRFINFLELLERLVNLNSFSKNLQGINQVQDILESELRSLGLEINRIQAQGSGDILVARTKVSVNASHKKDILLIGHVDTVFPPESSFQNFYHDSLKAYGPGVADMKGGVVMIITILKYFHQAKLLDKIPLRIIFNSDEETGSKNSKEVIQENAKESSCALVFEPGRSGNKIISKRKGIRAYEIEVFGKEAHSGSHHENGINAILALSKIVTGLSSLTDYDRGITCNFGLISGGSAVNVVPAYAKANFEIRACKIEDFLAVETLVNKLNQGLPRELESQKLPLKKEKLQEEELENSNAKAPIVRIKEVSSFPPLLETEESRQLYNEISQFSEKAKNPTRLSENIFGGASDANHISIVGTCVLDGFGPYGEGYHSDKEFILLESIIPRALNIIYWLQTKVEE